MAKVIKLESKKNEKETIAAKLTEAESLIHFEKLIKQHPLNQKALNRLMILYRKMKLYKKELNLINAAIVSFETFAATHKKQASKSVHSISHQLSQSLGLTDRKGKNTYDTEPIASWKKRREVVKKKLLK